MSDGAHFHRLDRYSVRRQYRQDTCPFIKISFSICWLGNFEFVALCHKKMCTCYRIFLIGRIIMAGICFFITVERSEIKYLADARINLRFYTICPLCYFGWISSIIRSIQNRLFLRCSFWFHRRCLRHSLSFPFLHIEKNKKASLDPLAAKKIITQSPIALEQYVHIWFIESWTCCLRYRPFIGVWKKCDTEKRKPGQPFTITINSNNSGQFT